MRIGGSYVTADFGAEAMIGSNFNCQSSPPVLNYRAYGHVYGHATAFGRNKRIFEAHVDYWKEGTQNGPQEAYLKVWDAVRWQQGLPSVCSQTGYNMRTV